ncbi:hypothetical protein NLM24_13235 [Nocardia zapadnayensis]|nr:hypothetical protein [Nocardia zapadnayensis]MCX0271654.1 hypothetical protein [Nocardia zapadnayensis]
MKKEAGREPRFRLAVEMTPPDLVWMLENSGSTTPLGPGHALSISTIAGPDPNSSPKLLYARDNITSPSGALFSARSWSTSVTRRPESSIWSS